MQNLLERIRGKNPANQEAAVIVMAAEAGLSDEDAKAFAEIWLTPEIALPELCRRAVMHHAGDRLTAAEVEQIVAGSNTTEKAKAAAVDMICEKRIQEDPQPQRVSVGASWDSGEGLRSRMIDGLRARINPHHFPDKGREFASMSMGELAVESLRAQGVKVSSQREAVNMVFSDRPTMSGGGMNTRSDFPNILTGLIGMEMAQAYEQQMPALLTTARRLPAPDFRQRVRPRLSTGPMLEKVNETGEYTYGSFSETGENQPLVETYGKMFRLSRQAIVNDNLAAFAAIPGEMARGAITNVRTLLIEPLVSNSGAGQTMLEDGNPLFHVDHGNLAASGASISITSVGLATTAMRRQKGLASELINVTPWALVVPPELETVALQLVGSVTPEQIDKVIRLQAACR